MGSATEDYVFLLLSIYVGVLLRISWGVGIFLVHTTYAHMYVHAYVLDILRVTSTLQFSANTFLCLQII